MLASLWCKTNFSFLEGASHPEEMVCAAQGLGYGAVAVTDLHGVYGVVRAFRAVKEHGLSIKLIVGSEIVLDDGAHVVVWAMHRQGYGQLCRLVSQGHLRAKKGESRIFLYELCDDSHGLCAALVSVPPETTAFKLRDAFGDRLYVGLARHERLSDHAHEQSMRALSKKLGVPTVVLQETLYHHKERKPLQDALRAIRHGIKLVHAGRVLTSNDQHALEPVDALVKRFKDDPISLRRTVEIAERCTFSLADLRYRYPSEQLPEGSTTPGRLRSLTLKGARQRYTDEVPLHVRKQIEKELSLIEELDYAGYFLTMYDVVQYCNTHNIICQGRGSAANSVVCYCLGITAVDPIKLDLLFERFLSRERAEPPDIDLDIEHRRREEVIQWVYQKYGRTHAAMVANVVCYRARSAIREVGKVLGIEPHALDKLAKLSDRWMAEGPDPALLQDAGLSASEASHEWLIKLSREIYGFPRHLSIHPGGFVLGHEPIATLVPIEHATMEDRTVIQWDKDDLETMGLFKVDLLGLGALTHIHHTFDLIASRHQKKLTMATVPAEDRDTYTMIQKSDTIGVFQIESRAQMSMLPRLKPETYYDLVIEVSIVRPGPITGGMVHPYLRRKQGLEPVVYPHPCLEPVLKKTLGVPLFQEQVIKLAMVAADYTPGEADQLRRDMAAWKKSGQILHHRERLISRMQRKGIEPAFAARVFEQIKGFGEYGFPESHAASFALISYVTAYLKCHYPLEFACGLLNAWPMGFYVPATVVEDAKRHGVKVLSVDINASQIMCTIEDDALRLGFRYVQSLQERDAEMVVAEAHKKPFESMREFSTRVKLNKRSWDALAEAGAFRSIETKRRNALWHVRGAMREKQNETMALSLEAPKAPHFKPLGRQEVVLWDYLRLGMSSHGHPLEAWRKWLEAHGHISALEALQKPTGSTIRYVGRVLCRQRPQTASGTVFMTLEDETGILNAIVWPSVFKRYRTIARVENMVGIEGEIEHQEGVTHLVARHLYSPRQALRTAGHEVLQTPSRDFH